MDIHPSPPALFARSPNHQSRSKLSRVRVGWGVQPVKDGRWRLGLFCLYRRYPDGTRGPDPLHPLTKKAGIGCVRISMRGVLLWAGALGCVAYFSGALVLLRWYERMPHNQVGYADLVMPTRWSSVSGLRGQALIAEGYEDLKAGRFQGGFAKLRAGVGRHPSDATARLDLARIYVSLRLRPAAERLLFDAFVHGYPGVAFVSEAVALVAEGDEPERSVLFCEAARNAGAQADVPASERRMLDELYARSLMSAGRPDEALAVVRKTFPAGDAFVRDVELRRLLEKKAHAEAISEVEAWVAQPGSPPEALRMAVRVYREAGRFDEMRDALARLRARIGASAEFGAFEVVQHALAGRNDDAAAAVEDFLFRYGANPRHHAMLAALLADNGAAALILRLEGDAKERGLDVARVRLARLRALVERREWAEACAVAESLRNGRTRWTAGEAALLENLGLLARACFDGESGAKAGLVAAIAKRPGMLKLYRTAIEGLASAGQPQTALAVLSYGEGRYPDSRYLAEARERLILSVAEADAIHLASTARKEETPLLANVPDLLKAVREHEEAGRRDEALTLIRRHRRGSPGVFADGNRELGKWEVRLSAEAGDLPALQFYLRAHLKTGALLADEALGLAKAWNEARHVDAARLTVRELLKQDPGNAAALKVWSEWMPTPDAVDGDAGEVRGGI